MTRRTALALVLVFPLALKEAVTMTPEQQGMIDILTRVKAIADEMRAEAQKGPRLLFTPQLLVNYADKLERAMGGEGGVNA